MPGFSGEMEGMSHMSQQHPMAAASHHVPPPPVIVQQPNGAPSAQFMNSMQLMFREMLAEFKQDVLREINIKTAAVTRHLDKLENMLEQSMMSPSSRYTKLSELDKEQNFQVMTILRQYVSSLLGQIKNMDPMQLQTLQNTEAGTCFFILAQEESKI